MTALSWLKNHFKEVILPTLPFFNLKNEFLDSLDIKKARELKRVLGELRPTAFGKAERGAIDLVTDKQINRTYSTIKQSMQNYLNKAKLSK